VIWLILVVKQRGLERSHLTPAQYNRAIQNRVRQTEINNPVKIAIEEYLNTMSRSIKNSLRNNRVYISD